MAWEGRAWSRGLAQGSQRNEWSVASASSSISSPLLRPRSSCPPPPLPSSLLTLGPPIVLVIQLKRGQVRRWASKQSHLNTHTSKSSSRLASTRPSTLPLPSPSIGSFSSMSTRRRSPLIDSFASAKAVHLTYSIAAASSYSGSYEPSNILTDKPHDLSSRWSGANGAAGSSANNVPAVAATAGPSRAGTSAAAALAAAAQQAASMGASPPPGAASSSSSSAAGGKQYIILKLSQLAVVSE